MITYLKRHIALILLSPILSINFNDEKIHRVPFQYISKIK